MMWVNNGFVSMDWNLSKELLGMVRSKYGTIPIPNSEVSLDGETLRARGNCRKRTIDRTIKRNVRPNK